MTSARLARPEDLDGLLALFRAAEVSAPAPPEEAAPIWQAMLEREGLAVFVSEAAGGIVATCMLVTAPNLLRGGRAHGFLENVVTAAAHRGQGHGRAVVRAALDHAWGLGCHHVLLQSGRPDPRVHRFYEGCGFVAGVRVGYVVRRER